MWKPIYDENHKIFSVDTSLPKKSKMIQKGLYEKLLCQVCETKLNDWESYTSQIMNHRIGNPVYDSERGILHFQNVDYRRLKLFQLSVLWRASICENATFRNVDLGPHEEKIRIMLFQENPGRDYQYGCAMIGLNSRAGIPMDHVILGPLMKRVKGHVAYAFVFARCLWRYIVSSHSRELRNEGVFLKESGELPVLIRDAEDLGLLDYVYKTFKEADVISRAESI